ncbi:Fanconi anemia core complex-associated protein 24-like [Penaeus japonicus]|uniref:Fanconi anemia core complex-associated protein 24-like n=1 Tax=Penaeus japonicus TaxID=27405 RepID=UPI001C7134B3|nr:Fanconi anemia core complex-associated protein 24-like [Penaeus japonicus]
MSALSQSTQVRTNLTIPPGHLLTASAWQGTQLASLIATQTNVLYSDGLGVVDFHPSADAAIIFISEADLLTGGSFKRRIVKFRQANTSLRGIVVAQKTAHTEEQFSNLQKFVCVELDLAIVPVRTISEAAQLLAQMVTCEAKVNANPFCMKPKTVNSSDAGILATTTAVPGLGEKRARQLLEHFGSLYKIANATQENLASVVGNSTASSVYDFFHGSHS